MRFRDGRFIRFEDDLGAIVIHVQSAQDEDETGERLRSEAKQTTVSATQYFESLITRKKKSASFASLYQSQAFFFHRYFPVAVLPASKTSLAKLLASCGSGTTKYMQGYTIKST